MSSVPRHLRRLPEEPPNDPGTPGPGDVSFLDRLDEDELGPLVRPNWWRWVAIAVIIAMIVAGPVAFALYRALT